LNPGSGIPFDFDWGFGFADPALFFFSSGAFSASLFSF
jgi:hypothetical protein